MLKDSQWWRGAIIYQILPRSYQDSNNDGIGDLAGIVRRLPYIASLGVDAIWISPFFPSPMKDFGYDVTDYRDVDPLFGSLADFDLVLATAHELGIKVMIDQVISHTSNQHYWFQQSQSNKVNSKADWYVWSDPKPDGTPPNNWLSVFGGPAWQWDTRREQYYLHNFLAEQPDLNFHNHDVQDALLDIFRFWLDRGVDGFRLDVINFYIADKLLRDNPPLAPERRNATTAPSVNPYNYQDHTRSKNQLENLDFLARLRALMDEYDSKALMGEVGDSQYGIKILGDYTRGDKHIHQCYAFDFLSGDSLSASRLTEVFAEYVKDASDGWVCWAFSNHDVVRHISRWNLSIEAARVYTTLMMCLRGSLCLYQGEELGLPEADIKYEDLQDPYGLAFWPEFKGRDGSRTPMVWESSSINCGFSPVKSWLPIPDEHLPLCVDIQEKDLSSLLHHYRRAIAFRKANPMLKHGGQSTLQANGNVASFIRSNNDEQIFCAFNLSDSAASLMLPEGNWTQIGAELGTVELTGDGVIHLEPWQPCIAIKI